MLGDEEPTHRSEDTKSIERLLSPDVRENVLRPTREFPEKVPRQPRATLEDLVSLPPGEKLRTAQPKQKIKEEAIKQKQEKSRSTGLQQKTKGKGIKLKAKNSRSARQEQKIQEQSIKLEEEKSRRTRLEQRIQEQSVKLKEEKSRRTRLEQTIQEQSVKLEEFRGLPRYKMSSHPRGICVIINNINFDGECKREGAELDERELARLYKELEFEVHLFRDIQCDRMIGVAGEFAMKDHSQFDAFVFIVMSHGGDKDVIYGVSGGHTTVEDLMSKFKAANCQTLQKKPKLFIIQTCRGSANESLFPGSCDSDTAAGFSPDSTLVRSVCPQEADFLLSFATAPGYKAWRHRQFGSPYIQFLVEEIRKRHQSHHLLDILTEVNRRVVEGANRYGKAIQCPAPTHTLQRQFFL